MTTNIFVYGTLMFPEIARAIAKLTSEPLDAVLGDYERYTVADREEPRVPAIKAEAGKKVDGKLFLDTTVEQVAALDHFEDVEHGCYTRMEVTVLTQSGEFAAQTYVVGPKFEPLLSDEVWSPALFERDHLDMYFNAVVKRYL